MKKTEDITLDDILLWILEHKSDIDSMDKVSYLAFGFSSKFLSRNKINNDLENGISIGE